MNIKMNATALRGRKCDLVMLALMTSVLAGCAGHAGKMSSANTDPTESASMANTSEKDKQMLRASWSGRMMEVQELLAKGMDPNTHGPFGVTALSLAAQNGHTKIVQLLLDQGANPNLQDTKSGWSPLMWAAYNGFDSVGQLLVDHGADLNLANQYGETALIQASFEGRDYFVKLLLAHGAAVDQRNDHGYSALKAAKTKGWFRITDMLVKAGARDDMPKESMLKQASPSAS